MFQHTSKNVKKTSIYTIPGVSDILDELANNKRDGWAGWAGMGGSVFQWHPELNIGFSYVPVEMLFVDAGNHKISTVQEILVDIVKKMKGGENIEET